MLDGNTSFALNSSWTWRFETDCVIQTDTMSCIELYYALQCSSSILQLKLHHLSLAVCLHSCIRFTEIMGRGGEDIHPQAFTSQ